jgi:hypothetical protein
MEWIYPVITLLSLLVAVLAATNKLVWAKEYRDAKDETIKAKEAQIELLKNEIQNLREFDDVRFRSSHGQFELRRWMTRPCYFAQLDRKSLN